MRACYVPDMTDTGMQRVILTVGAALALIGGSLTLSLSDLEWRGLVGWGLLLLGLALIVVRTRLTDHRDSPGGRR